MISLMARLEPLPLPNETLSENLGRRHMITLWSNDSTPIILGRGSLTGIADRCVGRNIVSLSFEESCLDQHCVKATLLIDSDKSKVHINGRYCKGRPNDNRLLSNGDTLSLDNLRYEYKVVVAEGRPATPSTGLSPISPKIPSEVVSNTNSLPTTPTTTIQSISVSSNVATQLSEEVQCSVCLEIQVHSRTLNPCGHSFCALCLEMLNNVLNVANRWSLTHHQSKLIA